MLKVFIKEYTDGNKKRIGDILLLKKDKIIELLGRGLKKRAIKKALEEELKIEIKDDTFYKWIKKNIENKPLTSPTTQKIKKSNSEGGKNAKVAQNGSKSPRTILEEVKSTGVEEDFDRNAGKTGFLDDI